MNDTTSHSDTFFPQGDLVYLLSIVCVDFGSTLNDIRRYNTTSETLIEKGGIDPLAFIDTFLMDLDPTSSPYIHVANHVARYTGKVSPEEKEVFSFQLRLALHKLLEGLDPNKPGGYAGYRVHKSMGAGQFVYIADTWRSEQIDPFSPAFNNYIPL